MPKKEGLKISCWHAFDDELEDEALEAVEQNPETKVALEAVEAVEQNPQTEVALVRIGTRGSPLALAQAYETKLMAKHQLDQSSRRHTPSNTACIFRKAQPPPPKKESLFASFIRMQQEAGQETGKELFMNVENAGKCRVARKLCKEAEQEAGTEQAGKRTPAADRFADRFADYENPKAIKPRALKKNELFVTVENAGKWTMVRKLCSKNESAAIVCCFFRSEADDISSYLNSRGVPNAKLHRDVHKSRQDGAIRSFNEKRVNVLVITMHMLLKSTISRNFHLINFEIPISFSDYDSLVSMPNLGTVTTFVNHKSGIGLKQLVEAVDVPEFVKTLADKVR